MERIKGKRVAVLAEKLYEDLELWYPVLRLREAGCDVKIVGPKAGETYTSKHGYPAKADTAAGDVTAADFDAIIIPGGYSPDHMRRCRPMVDLVTEAARQGKVVAAICHGAQLLAAAGVLKGRTCSAYPACAYEVTASGGTFADIPVTEAVTDGNLVTAPAWPAHPAWLRQFMALL